MKKIAKSEKLSLSQNTIRRLTDERLAELNGANGPGGSYSGCLITSTCYTKPTTYTNGCQ